MIRRFLLGLLALAVVSTAQAQTWRPGFAPGFRSGFSFIGGASTALPAPKFYVIGAYQQPTFTHAAWKSRGANTLFVVPGGTATNDWAASAKSLGFKQVRYPKGVTFRDFGQTGPGGASPANYTLTDPAAFAADMASGDLLAAAFFDEPSDVKDGSGTVGYGHGAFDPDMMDAILRSWRGYGVPTWLNQLGNHIRLGPVTAYMQAYASGGTVDWFASDSYPTEESRTWPSALGGRYTTDQGHDVEMVRGWSGGRPQMTFIGVSKQFSNFNQPTPDQVSAQIYSGIIHGAFGHCYFPIVLSPSFSFDGTPQNVIDRLATIHAHIASIHDNVLMDTVNGGRRPYLLRPSVTASGATPSGMQLPFGLEGAEIAAADGRTYRLLLNMTAGAISVTDSRWGLSALSIPAYGIAYGYTAAEMAASLPAPVTYSALQSASTARSDNIGLSNGNRTAAVVTDNNDFYKSVLGDTVVGTRKVAFEFTTTGFTNNSDQAGVGLTTSTTKLGSGARGGGTDGSVVFEPGGGKLEASNFSPFSLAAGDGTYMIAVDTTGTNNFLWVRKGASGNWNNSASANPATGVGGYDPGFSLKTARVLISMRDLGDAVTINTGNAALVGALPAGFGGL